MEMAQSQAAISTSLTLVEIEGKGRGLVASQPLKGGEIVLRDSPILSYFAFPLKRRQEGGSSSLSRYCAHCYRCLEVGTTTSWTCPSCSHPDDATFCGPNCQSLALRSTHTPWVCQALKFLRSCPFLVDNQLDERQVQARYLVAACNLAMVSPSAFQTLMSLDGGGDQGANKDAEAAFALHSIFSSLPFPQGLAPPSVEMTAALLAKDRCNAFGLMEPVSENKDRSVRAYAIYPNASFFNHDCLPNACRFDYVDSVSDGNTDMIIRIIHDVPKGHEICLSYFPVNLSYPERQKRLLDDYGFSCVCDRCKVEANWSHEGEDDEDEEMDEDDGIMLETDVGKNGIEHEDNDDFPHAYFFISFVCDRENCGGTLAPLPPSNCSASGILECNVCGNLKKEEM